MTAPKSSSTVAYPTGYESLGDAVQRKREIAKQLRDASLKGEKHSTYLGAFGDIAEAIAGRVSEKKADRMQSDLDMKQQTDWTNSHVGYDQLGADATPEARMSYANSHPGMDQERQMMAKVLEDKYKNENQWGDSQFMTDAQGNRITAQQNAAGGVRQTPGGFGLPPVITAPHGIAEDLQGAKPGQVMSQDPNDLVQNGPGGTPTLNPVALGARTQVAAAGAARGPDTKIMVNNAKAFGDGAETILAASQAAASGAVSGLDNIKSMRQAIASGNVMTGPGTGAAMTVSRLFGANQEKLASTRVVVQGLAEQTLAARGTLKGQGPVSDYEGKLLERAKSGDVDNLSVPELNTILNVAERQGNKIIERHQDLFNRAKSIPGAGEGLELYRVDPPSAPKKPQGSPAQQAIARAKALRGHR